MKISLKLNAFIASATLLLFVLSAGVSTVNFIGVSKIERAEQDLKRENEFELYAARAQYHTAQIQQFLTDASLTHEADSLQEAKENFVLFEKDLASLKTIHPDFAERAAKMQEGGRKLLEVGLEMTEAYWKSGKEAGDLIMKRPATGLDARSEEMTKLLDSLSQESLTNQVSSENNLSGIIHWLKTQTAILSSLLAGITLVVFGSLYRRLRPLTAVNAKLAENASQLTAASASMKSSAGDLTTANNEQAAATQETAASLEEIRAMVAKTAENSERLKHGADTSQNLVNTGMQRLQLVQSNLQEIDAEAKKLVTDVEAGNREILGIIGIISEISEKTNVINDIVFQTKLLSFNASVEAARAGEHGKGFAVVAEEVGNLASMSGQAAKDINGMLAGGIAKVESIIKANAGRIENSIGVSKAKIAEGVNTATQCGQAFNQIVDQVTDVKNVSEEITSAIQEQRKGLDEIGKAIASLEHSTHQNVAVSRAVEENGVGLSASVDGLKQTINEIGGIIAGNAAKAPTIEPVLPARPAQSKGSVKRAA